MDTKRAIEIAELWQAGKMIGWDENEIRDALLIEAKRQQTIEEYGLDIQFHGDHWRVFQNLNASKAAPDGNLYEGTGATIAEAFDNWREAAGV